MRNIKTLLILTVMFYVICLMGGGVNSANADYSLVLSLKVANGSSLPTLTSADYQLIIPSAFSIDHSGWNEITDGITAKVSGDNVEFSSKYKLVVTATTDGTLTATGITDTISYDLKVSSDSEVTTTWEFSADELNASNDTGAIIGTKKTLGVNVEDYSTKTNGDYSDTITFTAEVKAAVTLLSLTVPISKESSETKTIYYVAGETWGEAINNHPTENSSWYISSANEIVYQGVAGFVVDSGGGVLTQYSKINSSLTYYFTM